MIKSTINRRTNIVTTYKSIRKMSACVEKRGIFLRGWVVVCSLEGESWDGEEEGEIEEERVGRVWIYWLLPMESPTDTYYRVPVGNSNSEWAMSLYGDPGLNPLVIPLVKSSEKNPRRQTVYFF
jgi:hypothetical protein